jgi:hypothetical protein
MVQITNLKKDRKFAIRVLKGGCLVGITEAVLPQMLFLKREENFSKQITVSMTDTMKKNIMGKETKPMQIIVGAKIEYKEEKVKNGARSSSARPVPSSHALQVNDAKNGKKNSIQNSSPEKKNGVELKESNKINPRGSIYVVKDKNEKPKLIEIDEFGDVEKSFVDSIIGDDHATDLDNPDKNVKAFVEAFTNQSKEANDTEAENQQLLKEKSKILIPKLFELQKLYYSEFSRAVQVNSKLRELLIKYNEKFRSISKKSNRLREALESNLIRNDLTTFINKEENKRVLEATQIYKSELNLYKQLFKLEYNICDLTKFKHDKGSYEEDKEKKLLLKVISNIFKDNNLLSKIPEEKKIHLSYLASKYRLKIDSEKDDGRIKEDDISKEESDEGDKSNIRNHTDNLVSEKRNQINLDGDDEIEVREFNDKQTPVKKLSIVTSEIYDEIDERIDDYLLGFYSKRKMTQISFKRLSQTEYEFGTLKVVVKLDGQSLKGK